MKHVVKYKIYFSYVPSRKIYNWVGLESIDDFDVPFNEKPKRQQENNIEKRNERDNFFNDLENSILKNGFLNPILINAGKTNPITEKCLPKKVLEDRMHFLICDFLGGSRLLVAQKHNMNIPAIISDFYDIFQGYEILKDARDIKSKFYNNNFKVYYTKHGLKTTVPV